MSQSVVTVLTPNGRRQTVKVTPNQTILQILDEVCKKHDFQSQDYDLINHKRVLDLSLMFRFSGLPNNALLEMQAAKNKRKEEDVTIMLQLENGTRSSAAFNPSATVQSILDQLCPDESSVNAVIIYMRTEVHGNSLTTTTLKSLGLTSGRAIMRLIHRDPELLKTQANVSSVIPVKPLLEEPTVKKATKAHVTATKVEVETKSNEIEQKSNLIAELMVEDEKLDDSKILDVEPNSPSPVDRKKIKVNESGTEPTTSEHDITKPNAEDSLVHLLGDNNALLFSMDAMHREVIDVEDNFFELGISDANVLMRDNNKIKQGIDDAPLLTAKMREEDENTKQLLYLSRYKKTVIRIQFPTKDRLVLQGTFTPMNTIEMVMDFCRKYLTEPDAEFYLFTAPPKNVLSPESRLFEVKCVPAALLHFGTSSNIENDTYLRPEILTKLSTPSGAISEAKKSRGLSTTEMDVEESKSSEEGACGTSGKPKKQQITGTFKASSASAGPSDGKVPKWFKSLGK